MQGNSKRYSAIPKGKIRCKSSVTSKVLLLEKHDKYKILVSSAIVRTEKLRSMFQIN